jgi:uncharacterized repeat protein (TIGR01451 family)
MNTATKHTSITKWLGAGLLTLGMLAGSLGLGAHPAAADANMTMSIADSPDPVGVGETVTYSFTLRNAGDTGANQVILTADLSGGRFVGQPEQVGTTSFGFLRFGELLCNFARDNTRLLCHGGFFNAGEQVTMRARDTAPAQPGQIGVNARVSWSRGAEGSSFVIDTETTTVIARPDLRVTDINGPTAVGDGASGNYTVTVINRGGSRATGVRLVVRSETLPWDFFQVDVLDDASAFSCALTQTLSFLTPTVTCTGGSLDAGETARVRIRARTSNVLGTGNGRIRAHIDPNDTINESRDGDNTRNHAVSFNGGFL